MFLSLKMFTQNQTFVLFCFFQLLISFGSTISTTENLNKNETEVELSNIQISNILVNSTGIQEAPRTCTFDSECTLYNAKCFNKQCICKQGYTTTLPRTSCVPIRCSIDAQCKRYDNNSYCNFGSCNCYGALDPVTQRCTPKILNFSECRTSLDCKSNSVCFAGSCICQQGYYKSLGSPNTCSAIVCNSDPDCWSHDTNSHCTFGICICDGILDHTTQRCNSRYYSNHSAVTISASFGGFFVLLAIIGAVWFVYRRRTTRVIRQVYVR